MVRRALNDDGPESEFMAMAIFQPKPDTAFGFLNAHITNLDLNMASAVPT